MSIKKYTHEEFIKMAEIKGIKISKITRKMVHMGNLSDYGYWWP